MRVNPVDFPRLPPTTCWRSIPWRKDKALVNPDIAGRQNMLLLIERLLCGVDGTRKIIDDRRRRRDDTLTRHQCCLRKLRQT
jgi:hypothetical protein